jgi:hypothetical protein
LNQPENDALVDCFFQAAKSAAVAVYSAPEKLNEANTRLEEKLILENIFESRDHFALQDICCWSNHPAFVGHVLIDQ